MAKPKTEAKPKAEAAKKPEPKEKDPAKPQPAPAILIKDGRNFVPVKTAYAKYRAKEKYTGLIVSASGLGAKPAMFPLVLDKPSGLEVFRA